MKTRGKISSGNDARFYGLSLAIIVFLFRPRSINQFGRIEQLFYLGQVCFAMAIIAVALLRLIQKRQKAFSAIVWLVIIYKLWETLAIFKNGIGGTSTIVNASIIIGATICTELMLKRAPIEYLSTLSFYTGFLVFVNNISYFIGGFRSVTDATGNIVYFWSTRNHLSSLFFIAIISSFLINGMKRSRISFLWNIFVLLNVVGGTIMFQSATTIVGIAVYLLLYFLFKKRTLLYQPVKFYLGGLGLHIAIVIFRIQKAFSYLIEGLLHRSLTMSGRTLIWDTAMLFLFRSPIWGYGQSAVFTFSYAKSEIAAHNQFLDIGIVCGIPGIILFTITLLVAFAMLRNNKGSIIARIICCSLIAYIIMSITESPNPYQPWFILFGMIPLIPELDRRFIYVEYRFQKTGVLTRKRVRGNL